jgi:hypothetical protein
MSGTALKSSEQWICFSLLFFSSCHSSIANYPTQEMPKPGDADTGDVDIGDVDGEDLKRRRARADPGLALTGCVSSLKYQMAVNRRSKSCKFALARRQEFESSWSQPLYDLSAIFKINGNKNNTEE